MGLSQPGSVGGGSDDQTAAEVPFTPTGTLAATDVQAAVAEAASEAATNLATHEADTTSIHGIANTANQYAVGGTDVAVADGGTGSSTAAGARTNLGLLIGTDVPSQAAFADHSARHENGGADEISLAGLDGTPVELTNHLNDATDAHDASAVSVLDTGANFIGTNVETVLEELSDSIAAGGIPATIFDVKGDLIVASAADAASRLAAGTNGDVLTADSGEALGLKWEAPAGGGGVTTPTIIQSTRGVGTSVVLGSTPANGNRIILAIVEYGGGTVTAVASTNTTWTQIGTDFSTPVPSTLSIWVGVCAASAGTTITLTEGVAGTAVSLAAEVADALTPTAGTVLGSDTSSAFAGFPGESINVTAGHFLAALAMTDNSSVVVAVALTSPYAVLPLSLTVQATSLALGYAPDGDVAAVVLSGGGSSGGSLIASIT